MFKTLESKWNAHTPRFLHNGTKQNFIFQFIMLVLMLIGFAVKDKWEERSFRKWLEKA